VPAADAAAVSAAEAQSLFGSLSEFPVLILAVSGGPDSTALLVLAARWRKTLKRGPKLIAVTIDHGLRPEAKREAAAVRRLAGSLGVAHRIVRWAGRKPSTGLQQAARFARYRLLARAARKAGARHVLTAHTLDDQAETVLIRLARGSGVAGLAAMARIAPMPAREGEAIELVRPLLGVPKARLIATLRKARIRFADDALNRDPRFARARLRASSAALAAEGLSPGRLALLARRAARADAALDEATDAAMAELAPLLFHPWSQGDRIDIAADAFLELAEEIGLRLLSRVVAHTGNEGPVELGKVEALHAGLREAAPGLRFRQTLAGAVVTLSGDRLTVERAPPRRGRSAPKRP
jgi:tRNA(Ile)-lysidine synthase